MKMALSRLVRNEHGSTVVEFALICPMLIAVMLSVLEVGEALRSNTGVRDLLGWAGRRAVVARQNNTAITTAALNNEIRAEAVKRYYNIETARLTVQSSIVPNVALITVDEVRIDLTYSHPLSVPFVPITSIPISVSRTFYVQR